MRANNHMGFGVVLVASMALGCGGRHGAINGEGSAQVSVSTQALSTADVAKVNVTVRGAHVSPDITRALEGSPSTGWSGTINNIPAGNDRQFLGQALDTADTLLYAGSVRGVTIANGRTAMVNLFLQQAKKPDPFANSVPRITSLVISDQTVAPGQSITLTVTAVDPDVGDSLRYAWTGRDGTLGSPDAASTTWTAPSSDGLYELVASATDRAGATATVKAKLDVRVYHGSGNALVNATLNTWPVVEGLVPTPTRITVGQSTKLELRASDPDGDVLSYAWNAKCDPPPRDAPLSISNGTFDDPSAEDPSFTLRSLPRSGQCTLTATISDGRGGSNTASVTIEAGPGVGDVPTCSDGLRNGQETDVDCGGPTCPRCPDGGMCADAFDCLSGVCTLRLCLAASCVDRIKNGEETDVDCGGPTCAPCADGESCASRNDCQSLVCTDGACMAPTCEDRAKNGTETAIDCGGPACAPCADGKTCAVASDCQSGICTDGHCAVNTCGDGVVQAPEACDDGNTNNDDACRNDCTRPAVVGLAAGYLHTCALFGNGRVKCWGGNEAGQLGLGDTANRGDQPGEMGDALAPVDLGTGRKATALSAGYSHTCGILDDGSARCWGSNGVGQLGLGDTASRGNQPGEMGDSLPSLQLGTGRRATALSLGVSHSCALMDDGNVKCWGYNSQGVLGQGNYLNRGDQPGEMGDALPAVDLGVGRTATSVASGAWHTCAILDDSSVKCWGHNYNGQLGLGDRLDRGNQLGQMGDSLPAVDLGTGRKATAISACEYHTCAVLDDGGVKCWGGNAAGQLGLGDTHDRGDQPNEMGDNLLPVSLGTGRTALSLSCSGRSTCALLDNKAVKCWGYNGSGQLGLGDTLNRGDAPDEMGDNLPTIDLGPGATAVAISAGRMGHVCALLGTGGIKCWGQNTYGQLGLGDTRDRGDLPGTMGCNLPSVQLWGLDEFTPETFQVTETQVTVGGAYRAVPVLGEDAVSEILVYRQSGYYTSPYKIVAQRLNPDGTPMGPPIQVSSGTTDDRTPDISGSRIVYTSFPTDLSTQGHVVVFDLATMTSTTLTSQPVTLNEARIHGNIVVWTQGEPSQTRVLYFDLTWSLDVQPITLGGPTPAATEVAIGERLVVWSYCLAAAGVPRNTMAYDLLYGSGQIIGAEPLLDEHISSTHGPWVAWESASDTGSTIQVLNVDGSNTPSTIVNNGANARSPSIYGDMVAYDTDLAGNSDVHIYRMSNKTSYPVTNHPADQYANNLYKNKIAYVDTRNGGTDIYLSTFSFVSPNSCPEP